MKKLTVVSCLVMVLCAMTALAGEWTGYISDSKCGAAHTDGSQKSVKCVTACVKGGQSPVFVTADNKILKIADASKVSEHLGQKVTVTGELDGDTLNIDSVKAAE